MTEQVHAIFRCLLCGMLFSKGNYDLDYHGVIVESKITCSKGHTVYELVHVGPAIQNCGVIKVP